MRGGGGILPETQGRALYGSTPSAWDTLSPSICSSREWYLQTLRKSHLLIEW